VKSRPFYSLCALTLLVWGCPRRQNAVRVVYVPPPPVATTAQVEEPPVLIIGEPEPEPVAEEVVPVEIPEPPPEPPARRRAPRAETAAPSDAGEGSAEAILTPVPEVPALAPRETPQQAAALQRRVVGIQQDLHPRLNRLAGARLSAGARKTVEDARTFLAQSEKALSEGDLLRALNLAEKSALLVTAVESMR
jgi:hypothetical protein